MKLELRAWESYEMADPWPFLDWYWGPANSYSQSGVLALAATLTNMEVCMQQGIDGKHDGLVVSEHCSKAALVSSAMQMRYEFGMTERYLVSDSLWHICSLSRLEEATLCFIDVKYHDYADHGGWEASAGLQALRRLSIRCMCPIAVCTSG